MTLASKNSIDWTLLILAGFFIFLIVATIGLDMSTFGLIIILGAVYLYAFLVDDFHFTKQKNKR